MYYKKTLCFKHQSHKIAGGEPYRQDQGETEKKALEGKNGNSKWNKSDFLRTIPFEDGWFVRFIFMLTPKHFTSLIPSLLLLSSSGAAAAAFMRNYVYVKVFSCVLFALDIYGSIQCQNHNSSFTLNNPLRVVCTFFPGTWPFTTNKGIS